MAPVLQRALQDDRPGRVGGRVLPRPGRGRARRRTTNLAPSPPDHSHAVRAGAPGVLHVGARQAADGVDRDASRRGRARRSAPSRAAGRPCPSPARARRSRARAASPARALRACGRSAATRPVRASPSDCISCAAVKWMPSAPGNGDFTMHLAAVAVRKRRSPARVKDRRLSAAKSRLAHLQELQSLLQTPLEPREHGRRSP